MINGTKIITLCGSTRFAEEMLIRQWELTKQGIVVLSWCALPDSYFIGGNPKAHIGDQENVKAIVDEVHKRKIDLSDEILVIRAGKATMGLTYIGESTYSEMSYAYDHSKPIHFFPVEDILEYNWNHLISKKYRTKILSPRDIPEIYHDDP